MYFTDLKRRNWETNDYPFDHRRNRIDQGDSCPEDPLKVGAFKVVSDKEVEIQYTYSVQWIEDKEVTWNNRWTLYLVKTGTEVHWYSIVNSIVIMLFLTGVVAIIILKTLKKDIAIYNEEEMKDDQDDGSGWKLVHGDVFRTPQYSSILCALLGTGVQIIVMTISTICKCTEAFCTRRVKASYWKEGKETDIT